MKQVTYRRARRSDTAAIALFQINCAKESEGLRLQPKLCKRGVAAIFARPSMGRYFICEKSGRAVGCLLVQHEWSDWRNAMAWWIHSVYVLPEHRGQKLYTGLYEHVKKIALAHPKVFALRLYVDVGNIKAQRLYKKLGMSQEHYRLYEWMNN